MGSRATAATWALGYSMSCTRRLRNCFGQRRRLSGLTALVIMDIRVCKWHRPAKTSRKLIGERLLVEWPYATGDVLGPGWVPMYGHVEITRVQCKVNCGQLNVPVGMTVDYYIDMGSVIYDTWANPPDLLGENRFAEQPGFTRSAPTPSTLATPWRSNRPAATARLQPAHFLTGQASMPTRRAASDTRSTVCCGGAQVGFSVR